MLRSGQPTFHGFGLAQTLAGVTGVAAVVSYRV
jgi:hypothetical protein